MFMDADISELNLKLLKSFKFLSALGIRTTFIYRKFKGIKLLIVCHRRVKLPRNRALTIIYLLHTPSQPAAVTLFLDCKTYINSRKEKGVLLRIVK